MKPLAPLLLSLTVSAACGGGVDQRLIPDAGADAAFVGKRLFVTRTTYTGDLGGLSGADQNCQNSAAALALGGNWTAWLSDFNQDAIDRINGEGPWHSVAGQEIFRNRAGLAGSPLTEIRVQEDGETVSLSARAWTGTRTGGTLETPNCSEWTTTEGEGTGGATESIAGWTQNGSYSCISARHLYCFED